MDLKQHALSAAFPSMSEDEFAVLVEDIRAHGQREAIIVFDGEVLDGWHRYRACEKAGKKCVTVTHDGSDPVAFVLSRNLHRRHLSGSQRAEAVVAATNWKEAGRPGKGDGASPLTLTVAEMAKVAEVSERTIQRAKVAHGAGLGEDVRDGKVSVEQAVAVAKLPAKKREAAVAAIERGEDPLPKAKKPTPPPHAAKEDAAARIAELEAENAELREHGADLAETAHELELKVTAYEIAGVTDQQKEIVRLQKEVEALNAKVKAVGKSRNEFQEKCNELIREVKSLQRKARK